MKINSKIENITNNRQTLSVQVKLFFQNCIYNERGGFLNFFEEDLKKMEKMTENEIKDFQKELINEGRYKLEFISKNKPDNIN